MYNVMIVDDEDPVLNSYAYMVEHGSTRCSLAALADCGRKAIEEAEAQRPDIIFMDIGMPDIDGLKAIDLIREVHPKAVFIISTAYERFDLAKKAIPLGVLDYLVKPISKKRFLGALEAACNYLEENAKRSGAKFDKAKRENGSRRLEEKQFLMNISWKALEEREWECYKEILDLSSDRGRMAILNQEMLPETLQNSIVEQLSRKYCLIAASYLSRLCIFFSGFTEAPRLEAQLNTISRNQLPQKQRNLGWGIGGLYDYSNFFRSFEEALSACSKQGSGAQTDFGWEMVQRVRRQIRESRDLETAEIYLNRYSEALFGSLPFVLGKVKMIELFTLLLDDQKEVSQIRPAEEIWSIENLSQWKSWYKRRLPGFLSERKTVPSELPPVLERALSFIESNYHRNIGLSEIAEACSVSSCYISRMFSCHLNSSCIDHLTARRIEEAEKLMKSGDAPIKEIALAVGFSDPNYFSRIFRKHRGMSPRRYIQELSDD